MTKALFRDTLRAIRKTMSRFISIVIIVALGVGFYAGLKAVSPTMKGAADAFYREHNMADLVLVSTVGFDERDVEAVLSIEGIAAATPSRYVDGLVYNDDGELAQSLSGTAYVLRIIGYDFSQMVGSGSERLNQLKLVRGRLPEAPDECVASVYEADVNLQDEKRERYQIDQKITVKGDHEDLLESIQSTEFTVVGLVYTPEFVSMELGASQAGGGELSGYVYIPDSAFIKDYYTQLYISIAGSDTTQAYSQGYEEGIRLWKDALVDEYSEPIVASRAGRMRKTIAEEAYAERKKIGDFLDQTIPLLDLLGDKDKAELNALLQEVYRLQASAGPEIDPVADFERQIADGKQELALAGKILPLGRKALENAPREYERQKARSDKEIADGEKEVARGVDRLEKGKAEYNAKLAEYNKGMAEYEKARKQIEANADIEGEYIEGKNKLDMLQSSYDLTSAGVRVGRVALNTAEKALASENAKRIEDAMRILEGYFPLEPASMTVEGLQQQVLEAREQLDVQEAELVEYKRQLDEGKAKLKEAEVFMKELEKFRAAEKQLLEAYALLSAKERELADGQTQVDAGRLKVEQGKVRQARELAGAEKRMADGEASLRILEEQLPLSERRVRQGENALEALPNAMWVVTTRDIFAGYTNYGDTAENMQSFAVIFPVLFFLVAALVSLTTMTRMVEDERLQLGVLKAAGYSAGAIAFKYFFYAATTAVLGSALGLALGFTFIPYAIFQAYTILYLIPSMTPEFFPDTALLAFGAAVISTVGAVIFSVLRSLRLRPAQLMRPKAPKAGKRVFLERIKPLWNALNFDGKVTVRNLMRNKKRFIMTFAGIMSCTALLLTGFGIGNSIGTMLDRQFGPQSVMRFDGQVMLTSPITADDDTTMEVFDQPGRIELALPIFMKAMYATAEGFDRQLEVTLVSPRDYGQIPEFLALNDDKTGEELIFKDNGIYINGKTAELMDLKEGDTITIQSGSMSADIPVAGIVRNYIYHYAYMTPAVFEYFFDVPQIKFNTVLIKLNAALDTSGGSREAVNLAKEAKSQLSRDLTDEAAVTAVAYNSAIIDKVGAMLDAMRGVIVAVFVLASGALAFVVLYNLNNINIYERIRELATIKVLGFYDMEASMYIYRENIILTVLGVAAGLLLGIPLHGMIVRSAEIESMMFVRTLAWDNYLYAALITTVFAVGINALSHRRIKGISMVESLKSVE